jgi:RNA 3'-terminal phosphate cyclase (ATP)
VIEIDGSEGEGGGQILRSALALSMCTGQPFRILGIRAKRDRPGLLRQHLTAVRAATEISDAEVVGDEVGSQELAFRPRAVKPGNYGFAIGTAGSCTLVLQTVLPGLMAAAGRSTVRISGGTHNKAAPPVDFLARAFLPLLARMGPRVSVELVRHGFHPRGGGEILATIEPAPLRPLELLARGERRRESAEAYVAAVPMHVAERELEVAGRMLNWAPERRHVRGLPNDVGPGNVLTLTVEHEHVTEVFTGFGERGVSAEQVARGAADEVRGYLASTAAVGCHLADQLLLPMALAGRGAFTTLGITPHFRSQVAVIGRFGGAAITTSEQDGLVRVAVGRPAA